jgi:DNA-directed RNA polymerase sigma subunit (sigma70/sigma32)
VERELVRAGQAGDRRARARLVEAFLPLIASVARLYRESPRVHRVELIQGAWWRCCGRSSATTRLAARRSGRTRPGGCARRERVVEAIEAQELLSLLSRLSDRERTILRARYGLDSCREQSLREVGARLGLSAERVRQLEQRALGKLAVAARADGAAA